MATPYTECYIFVDYSNLWIAGQTARAKKLGDAESDRRFRVDFGRFKNLVAKDRHVSKAFLYGSVPPPNDSVWKAAKEQNYEVNTYNCSGSGKQKEVDTAMTTNIMEELYELECPQNATFIIVTGDRDFNPPIEKCLKKKVYVELWSWEHSMAVEYKRLANSESLFTTNKLDEFQDKFGFTAYLSTRVKKDTDPTHAIVYRDVPKGKSFEHKLVNHISRLWCKFFITCIDKKDKKEDNRDIIVEFPESGPDYILTELRKLGEFGYQPCSYPEYTHPVPEELKHTISYMYEAKDDKIEEPEAVTSSMKLDVDNMDKTEQQASGKSDKGDTWYSVLRRKPGLLTSAKRRREMSCKWGEHCSRAARCPYSHTEYEKKLFRLFPRVRFKYFKVKECGKKDTHTTPEQRRMCIFAHCNEDSWCLHCIQYGHLSQDCKAA